MKVLALLLCLCTLAVLTVNGVDNSVYKGFGIGRKSEVFQNLLHKLRNDNSGQANTKECGLYLCREDQYCYSPYPSYSRCLPFRQRDQSCYEEKYLLCDEGLECVMIYSYSNVGRCLKKKATTAEETTAAVTTKKAGDGGAGDGGAGDGGAGDGGAYFVDK